MTDLRQVAVFQPHEDVAQLVRAIEELDAVLFPPDIPVNRVHGRIVQQVEKRLRIPPQERPVERLRVVDDGGGILRRGVAHIEHAGPDPLDALVFRAGLAAVEGLHGDFAVRSFLDPFGEVIGAGLQEFFVLRIYHADAVADRIFGLLGSLRVPGSELADERGGRRSGNGGKDGRLGPVVCGNAQKTASRKRHGVVPPWPPVAFRFEVLRPPQAAIAGGASAAFGMAAPFSLMAPVASRLRMTGLKHGGTALARVLLPKGPGRRAGRPASLMSRNPAPPASAPASAPVPSAPPCPAHGRPWLRPALRPAPGRRWRGTSRRSLHWRAPGRRRRD